MAKIRSKSASTLLHLVSMFANLYSIREPNILLVYTHFRKKGLY